MVAPMMNSQKSGWRSWRNKWSAFFSLVRCYKINPAATSKGWYNRDGGIAVTAMT